MKFHPKSSHDLKTKIYINFSNIILKLLKHKYSKFILLAIIFGQFFLICKGELKSVNSSNLDHFQIKTSITNYKEDSVYNFSLSDQGERIIRGSDLDLIFDFENNLNESDNEKIILRIKNRFFSFVSEKIIRSDQSRILFVVQTDRIKYLGNHTANWEIFIGLSEEKIDEGVFNFELIEGLGGFFDRCIELFYIILLSFGTILITPYLYRETISSDYTHRTFMTRSVSLILIVTVIAILFASFFSIISTFIYLSLIEVQNDLNFIFYDPNNIIYGIIISLLAVLYGSYCGLLFSQSAFRRIPSNKLYTKFPYFGYLPYSIPIFLLIIKLISEIYCYQYGFMQEVYFFPNIFSVLTFPPSITLSMILFFLIPCFFILKAYIHISTNKMQDIKGLLLLTLVSYPAIVSYFFFYYSNELNYVFFILSLSIVASFLLFALYEFISPKIITNTKSSDLINVSSPMITLSLETKYFKVFKFLYPLELHILLLNMTSRKKIKWQHNEREYSLDYNQKEIINLQIFNKEYDFAGLNEDIPQFYCIKFIYSSLKFPFLRFQKYCLFEISRKGMISEALFILKKSGFKSIDIDRDKRIEYPSPLWSHFCIVDPESPIREFQNYKIIFFTDPHNETTHWEAGKFIDFIKDVFPEEYKEILTFFIYSNLLDDAKAVIISSRWRDDLKIVPLSNIDFFSVETNKESLIPFLITKYRSRFLESDPYAVSITGEITDPADFYGRENEIEKMKEAIKIGKHTGVFGIRKIGKSSLLKILTKIDPNLIIIKINVFPSLKVFDSIYNMLIDVLEKKNIIKVIPKEDKEVSSQILFKRLIENYEKQLNKSGKLNRICIVLDEIDGMENSNHFEFWHFLRQIAEQTQSITYFIIGNQPLINRKHSVPVYQFFDEFFLPPFSYEETKKIIETLGSNLGLKWDEDIIGVIHNFTGGHPLYTKKICSLIWRNSDNSEKTLTKDDFYKIEELIKDEFVSDLDDVISDIFGGSIQTNGLLNSKEVQMGVLQAIGKEKEISIESLVEEFSLKYHVTQSDIYPIVRRIIGHLKRMHIIYDDTTKFRFSSGLLRYWITQRLDLNE